MGSIALFGTSQTGPNLTLHDGVEISNVGTKGEQRDGASEDWPRF